MPLGKITETATASTFPNTGTTGDCMGDALKKQKKDVTEIQHRDQLGRLAHAKSDGGPDLSWTKKTVGVSAPSGHYEGSVPFILDTNVIFPGDGTMNFDHRSGWPCHSTVARRRSREAQGHVESGHEVQEWMALLFNLFKASLSRGLGPIAKAPKMRFQDTIITTLVDPTGGLVDDPRNLLRGLRLCIPYSD